MPDKQVAVDSLPIKKKRNTEKRVKKSKRQKRNKSNTVKKFLRSPTPDFEGQLRHQLEVYNELLPIANGDQSLPDELDYDIGQACPPTPDYCAAPNQQEEADNNTLENFNDVNFDQVSEKSDK